MKHEIDQCEEKLLQAFRTSDIKALDELIHDNLIFNGPTGEIIDKEMDLDAYRSGHALVDTLDCIDRKTEIFDDTAVVSTVIYLKGSFMEHKIDGKARFLRIWKKSNGRWKVIGGSSIVLG